MQSYNINELFSGSGSRDAYNEQQMCSWRNHYRQVHKISVLITVLGSDGSGESAQTPQHLHCMQVKGIVVDEDPDQRKNP